MSWQHGRKTGYRHAVKAAEYDVHGSQLVELYLSTLYIFISK